MVIWKECEDEIDDIRGGNDQGTVHTVRECGWLKLFMVPSMRE